MHSRQVRVNQAPNGINTHLREGYCPHCSMSLHNGEELHAPPLVPRSQGGGDEEGNRKLLHLYYHQQINGGRHERDADCLSRMP